MATKVKADGALLEHVALTLDALAPCSGAVVVLRRGELLLERYLRGSPQDEAQAVDAGSLWPWWSVTKSVASALVARLASRGLFDLDAPLSSALREFGERGRGAFDRRSVTLRHLMSHTSGCVLPGLPDDGMGLGLDMEAGFDLEMVEVATEPGKAFLYSALGMGLLERFVEAATGEDFGLLMRREILGPCGMGGARYLYRDDLEADPGLRSRALACDSGKISFSQRRQRAGLGLYGSARDLAAFGRAWLELEDSSGAALCDAALRDQVWTRHSTRPSDGSDYGLLWWLFPELGGYVASGAAFDLCALLPAQGIVAVVMRNHYGPASSPFDYRAEKARVIELAGAFA
jgi:Beta-lactamase class C and other penicillin binding proteins